MAAKTPARRGGGSTDNLHRGREPVRRARRVGRAPRSGNGKNSGDYGHCLSENFVHINAGIRSWPSLVNFVSLTDKARAEGFLRSPTRTVTSVAMIVCGVIGEGLLLRTSNRLE